MQQSGLTALIRNRAIELGFDLCGIAEARRLDERARVLEQWCREGMNAGMNYLARDIDKRSDPSSQLADARSVIVTAFSYNAAPGQLNSGVPILSRYVYGGNYHEIIKSRLNELQDYISGLIPGVRGRVFVDSGPVMEKAWAVEAGLGWQGRHSVVINPDIGSFFFIGLIIVDAELDYDLPFRKDLCGSCSICIDSCPTQAINQDHTIDARKCISNLTIENRGPIPEEFLAKTGKRVYGCDICQEVCPWNRDAPEHRHIELRLPDEIANMTPDDWLNLSEERFNFLFAGTEIARKKYAPFMRNVTDVTK
ncbi:MAG: tRNA epoxyqueuosine(34) reductase QueG [Bacteroidales bacterium]|nr:tRNA epoxyqueuosine(34) reductase QueG [Bacteroidales bacterium]